MFIEKNACTCIFRFINCPRLIITFTFVCAKSELFMLLNLNFHNNMREILYFCKIYIFGNSI